MASVAKQKVHDLVYSKKFEFLIMIIILINCVAIGLETYQPTPALTNINFVCLLIYTIEISLRFAVRDSLKGFFTDGWNLFDLFIVVAGYIPEDLFENAGLVAAFRVLRVFRILKLFKTSLELRLIISVMIRSMRALTYNAMVMLIFMYVFAIAGIYLFRLPSPENLPDDQKEQVTAQLQKLYEIAPHSPGNADDPYGTLPEAMFTLLRCMSGDDWTDLRYNLVTASRMNLIPVSPVIITIFHVFWYVFAAFLLINLVVGAVINNYTEIMEAEKKNIQKISDRMKD
ncbi:MAG: ion transporter [Succinivibrionaceae bacterium]|nr:ion transporter [Succinivibrionaceae bacterium]